MRISTVLFLILASTAASADDTEVHTSRSGVTATLSPADAESLFNVLSVDVFGAGTAVKDFHTTDQKAEVNCSKLTFGPIRNRGYRCTIRLSRNPATGSTSVTSSSSSWTASFAGGDGARLFDALDTPDPSNRVWTSSDRVVSVSCVDGAEKTCLIQISL